MVSNDTYQHALTAHKKEETPQNKEVLDSAQKSLTEAKQEEQARKIKSEEQQALLKSKENNVNRKQQAFDDAKLRLKSSASGDSFSEYPFVVKIDPQTSAALAKSVEHIVESVVSKSFIEDTCMKVIQNNNNSADLAVLMPRCMTLLIANAETRKALEEKLAAQSKKTPSVSN